MLLGGLILAATLWGVVKAHLTPVSGLTFGRDEAVQAGLLGCSFQDTKLSFWL